MAGTSSLLRSASARRAKVQAYEDSVADFEWSRSAQTLDDFLRYESHLKTRATSASDPQNALTYQRKILTANRSYTSQELERRSIDILEGRGSLEDKQASIESLYSFAVSTGDYNTAQNLRNKWDTVEQQIQNQALASQSVARDMAQRDVRTVKEYVNSVLYGSPQGKKGVLDDSVVSVRSLGESLKNNGVEFMNTVGSELASVLGLDEQSNFWDAQVGLINQMLQNVQIAADNSSDPAAANDLIEIVNGYVNDVTKIDIGDKSFSLSELQQIRDAQAAGQPLYVINNEGKLIETKKTGYIWAQKPDGSMYLMDARSVGGSPMKGKNVAFYDVAQDKVRELEYTNPVTGKKVKGATPEQVLKDFGFGAEAKDGTFQITQTQASNFGIQGMDLSVPVTAYLDEFGDLQFSYQNALGEKSLYTIQFNEQTGRPEAKPYNYTDQTLVSGLVKPKFETLDSYTTKLLATPKETRSQTGLLQPARTDLQGSSYILQQAQNTMERLQPSAPTQLQAQPTANFNQLAAPKNFTLNVAPPVAPKPIKLAAPVAPRPVKVNTTPKKANIQLGVGANQGGGLQGFGGGGGIRLQ
jgi:hypothetical protein